ADAAAERCIAVAVGTLHMYRLMAEQASDPVCRPLGHQAACTTSTPPLPGNESDPEPAAALAARCGIPALAAIKLQTRHGSNSEKGLDEGHTSRILCRGEPGTGAELRCA